MTTNHETPQARLRNWMTYYGVAMLILGSLAIIFPFLASAITVLALGWIFLAVGIVRFIHAFKVKGVGNVLLRMLLGAIYLIAAIYLLAQPVVAITALTLFLGIFFVVEGVIETVFAVMNREMPHWGWVLFDGLITILLGVIIWKSWPASSLWVIGTLVGISILFSGWSALMYRQLVPGDSGTSEASAA